MANVGKVEILLTGVMPRCRDCRFWAKSLGAEVDARGQWAHMLAEGEGWCLAMLSGSHTGEDGCPSNPLDIPGESRLAMANDDEGFLATIWTREDFGCVLFQQREPERG